jgi:hypothetical protein
MQRILLRGALGAKLALERSNSGCDLSSSCRYIPKYLSGRIHPRHTGVMHEVFYGSVDRSTLAVKWYDLAFDQWYSDGVLLRRTST